MNVDVSEVRRNRNRTRTGTSKLNIGKLGMSGKLGECTELVVCSLMGRPSVNLQGAKLNMAVFFWYLVISYLYSVRYCTLDKSLFTRY